MVGRLARILGRGGDDAARAGARAADDAATATQRFAGQAGQAVGDRVGRIAPDTTRIITSPVREGRTLGQTAIRGGAAVGVGGAGYGAYREYSDLEAERERAETLHDLVETAEDLEDAGGDADTALSLLERGAAWYDEPEEGEDSEWYHRWWFQAFVGATLAFYFIRWLFSR